LGAGVVYSAGWHRNIAILSQGLKFVAALLVLVAFQWLGELAVWITGWAIPGPLMGMLILLLVLTFVDRPMEFLDKTSGLLIQNLSLMFIPISVGAFFLSRDIYQQFPAILTLILLSTSGVILFMALLIKRLEKHD
jgi:holin-like protein